MQHLGRGGGLENVTDDLKLLDVEVDCKEYTASEKRELNGYGKSSDDGPKRKKRSPLACLRCRRRHVKCPGGNPCEKCLLARATCEYMEPSKKLIISMKYLQKLQDDLVKIKNENASLQAQLRDRPCKCEGTRSTMELLSQRTLPTNSSERDNITFQKNSVTVDEEDEIVPNFTERRGRLVESRTGQRFFVGSSSMTLFGMEIQSLIPASLKRRSKQIASPSMDPPTVGTADMNAVTTVWQGDMIDEVLQEEGNAYKIVLGGNDPNRDPSVNFTLPSYSYAMRLVDIFIEYNDGCFYFFNEGIVKEHLHRTYEGTFNPGDDTLQTIWLCKLLLIFATGEMYQGTAYKPDCNNKDDSSDPNGDYNNKIGPPGSGFFEQASRLFSFLFSGGKIENVTKDGGIELMLLYAFYLQVADCTAASYFYFGQTIRACLILGWHVDAERDVLTRFQLEHRRRIWWTVYMFERMLSSKAGLPLSFSDNTISAELPDDFDMTNPPKGCEHYIFPEAEYITNCVRITQLNAQILSKLYQRQPDSNILPMLKEIVLQLLQWRTSLSDFLQVDFHQPELHISRLCTNIFTEYFQGLNLAIRPLLFHFVSKQLAIVEKSNSYINLSDYSKTISSLLNCSLEASINSIRSLYYLFSQNMVALFGYMDREYLFTSACTLVLFNAAFGIHEQTYQHIDHALKIFTKMRALGNNPAGLRMAQLLTLMSELDFHGVMNDLIAKHNELVDIPINIMGNIPELQQPTSSHSFNTRSQDADEAEVAPDFSELSKTEARTIERNVTRLDLQRLDTHTDGLQELLDNPDELGKSDDQLWKEITDQAMWLGNTMDPTHGLGNESDFYKSHPLV
ncbi:HDR179Cp [Eremothecium sinecaudum]|uniref:HDR179Cp n=1 Tax=Eremothecium sinecaudum TaxID=45286 RepID=A0A0X8HSA3_9SACH|nr:HDR179Cp [Eremothecium sinecaudum]AMD20921.1 HDR179Cp [Eremothecium sinecaudum]